jgi:hypothetical protein
MTMKNLRPAIWLCLMLYGSALGWPTNSWAAQATYRTNLVTMDYPVNFRDDKLLIGAAHNVFVARVIRKVGLSDLPNNPKPHTRFEVEVVLNVKGNLQGKVFIDQFGGIKDGAVYRAAGDGHVPLLEPGATYALVTRSPAVNPDNIYRLATPPNACSMISQDTSLSAQALEVLAAKSKRVSELREAYVNEIVAQPFQKDARNPYKQEK